MIERITLQNFRERPIRSFVERKGRISSVHKELVDSLWPKFGLSLNKQCISPAQIFGREAPLILEIGFGDARSLLQQAAKYPEHDFIGIEVYKAGIVKLLVGMHERGLSNIRIYCADAIEVLNNCIPNQSLSKVQLFFPDPWPKARHHKRRIVQPEFIASIFNKLQNDGVLHLATDWQDYAEHMLNVMEMQDNWTNEAGKNEFAVRPASRPLTKFEQRGLRLGYGTWDLIFRKSIPNYIIK